MFGGVGRVGFVGVVAGVVGCVVTVGRWGFGMSLW